MQINAANLLIAQQNRGATAPRPTAPTPKPAEAAEPGAFESLVLRQIPKEEPPQKAATATAMFQPNVRPGTKLDIKV